MDLLQLKLEYELRLKRLNEELIDFIMENCIDSEYGDIEGIDKERLLSCDLTWNNAVDERHYNILQNAVWITNNFIEWIDRLLSAQGDEEKLYRTKKDIPSLIHEVKRKIGESDDVIQREHAFQNSCEEILELLGVFYGIS